MTSLPTRSRWWNTTPSFCNLERTLVTSLQTKLNQLSLTTMSKQLDQMIAEGSAHPPTRSLTEVLATMPAIDWPEGAPSASDILLQMRDEDAT